MNDAHGGDQASLHVRKNRRHPRIHRQRFHVIGDQAVEKHHGFGAADEQASA